MGRSLRVWSLRRPPEMGQTRIRRENVAIAMKREAQAIVVRNAPDARGGGKRAQQQWNCENRFDRPSAESLHAKLYRVRVKGVAAGWFPDRSSAKTRLQPTAGYRSIKSSVGPR